MATHESKTTRDHDTIRRWAEQRDGKPAAVSDTGGKNDPGILRIDFPGGAGEPELKPIDWDTFFEKFDENNLVFLYQEQTKDGGQSRFFKFVSEETAKG